ncbi:cytochrome P450 [Trichoderma compactum]
MAVTELLLNSPLGLVPLILLLLFIAGKIMAYQMRKQLGPLPPGPPGELFLGHLRIIPTAYPEYFYMRLSQKYKSDILSFNVLGQPVIIPNSVQAVADLLDKRGANYCDRPRCVLFEMGLLFRLHRRTLQRSFQKSNIGQYRYLQEREAVALLRGIMDKPAEWEMALRRFSTAIALGVGFVAEDASYALGHGGAPAGTPVDFFPLFRYLPGTRVQSLVQDMIDQRESQVQQGQVPDVSEQDVKGAGAAVFAAAQDTTWSTLVVFILSMVLHPEVQSKAQRLLDQVAGRDRLPTFDDRPNLQYIDFIVQETFRWSPVSPMGVPHRSLKDDIYRGYLIPAGSFVYANTRAMTHNEAVYKSPDDFDPDRYFPLEQGGRGEPLPNGQFGFGRRICVGQHFAEATIWLVVAVMLSTMSIEREKDASGAEIMPAVELTSGLTSHPKRFPCLMRPRDEKSGVVIRDAKA